MRTTIIAHGGAWDWNDDLDAGKKSGIENAIAVGRKILHEGGAALDAVEATVVALENDPAFDAGTGGFLNRDGEVQLDALVVDGQSCNFGAVAGVRKIENPVRLARKIMEETEQAFFVGSDADRIADQLGIALIDNSLLVTDSMWAFFKEQGTDGPNDTVGALAIDANGNYAAATSTSGTPYKPAGRVGDTPIFGAGAYCSNNVGAAGATGQGEQIMRTLLSKFVCDRLSEGKSAAEAATAARNYFDTRFPNSMSGVILIDQNGVPAAAQTAPKMAFGWTSEEGEIRTATKSAALTA